jgi:putative exporter of polyketide antibiotics
MSTMLATIFFASVTALLYMLQSELHRLACKAFGFVVIGNGYAKRHYTLRYSEAVSWAACYSEGANVYKRGTWVASSKLQ